MSSEEWIAPEDIETEEGILRRLEEVETKLATRENITHHKAVSIRQQLVTLIKHQVIPEDELVSEWLDLYTTHTYWQGRKDRPRNVSVSLYDSGNGELVVWSASFTIPGSLERKDGKVDESDRVKKQKAIQKILAKLDFTDI